MNTRFEIPVELADYNIFAIDDFLRSMRTVEQRQELIKKVGYSAAGRRAYETEHGLPSGAVELAMLAQDRRVKEMGENLRERFGLGGTSQPTPQQLKELYYEIASMTGGLRELYPEALRFLKNYGVLAQRNKRTYAGDYHFGNEYRILLCSTCPGPNPPQPPGWFQADFYTEFWFGTSTLVAVGWLAQALVGVAEIILVAAFFVIAVTFTAVAIII
jgi:hypothetical protein